jgi:hypothetical protein
MLFSFKLISRVLSGERCRLISQVNLKVSIIKTSLKLYLKNTPSVTQSKKAIPGHASQIKQKFMRARFSCQEYALALALFAWRVGK